MAVPIDGGIIAVIVLVSVLVLLVLLFVLTSLVVVRKKRLLCFKRNEYTRPFLLSDRELERRRRGLRGDSRLPYGRKAPKKNKNRANRKKEGYQSFSKALMFPKRDPFAKIFLENPMIDSDELDMDWTNPAFDAVRAQKYDAVLTIQSWYRMIRVRVPFVQLRRATVLVQALYRGRTVRAMLPWLRKEKAQKDQLKKKHAGWKKKGTLAALKYYDVKAFGFAEVEQLYGMETVRNAADQLKDLYGGKGKLKLKLFISIKGIKLYHIQTMEHFATVRISTVSFCTLDPKNKKVFAFINRKKRRNFCHVFQANESDAQKMVETMAEAFEVTFRKLEQQRKQKESEREEQIRKERFDRESQQLEDEVHSMMEMAETASSGMLVQERLSEVSSENGSLRGSTEKLLASPERRPHPARSSLVTSSYRAPLLPNHHPQPQPQQHQHRREKHRQQQSKEEEEQEEEEEEEEPFDIEKVDEYFTGIKEGVDIISVSLEKDSQQAQVVSAKKRLEKNLEDLVERFS